MTALFVLCQSLYDQHLCLTFISSKILEGQELASINLTFYNHQHGEEEYQYDVQKLKITSWKNEKSKKKYEGKSIFKKGRLINVK